MSGESAFVVHRLRAKPVEYTITISHFVRAGEWVMSVACNEIADTREDRLRVAADLATAARWIEEDNDAEPSTDNPIPPTTSQLRQSINIEGAEDVVVKEDTTSPTSTVSSKKISDT